MRAKRLTALDIFRGFLVLGMIVFHARLHLFTSPIPEVFLYFIPTGFVLFSGVLLGRVLRTRKSVFQLVVRGGKLLLLFLLANTPFWMLNDVSFQKILSIFFWGDPEFSSFEILIPIALTIISGAVLLQLKVPPLMMISGCFLGLLLLDFLQVFPFTLKFFLVGLLGIFLGMHSGSSLFLQIKKSPELLFTGFLTSAVFFLFFFIWPTSWSLQVLFTLSLSFWLPVIIYHVPHGPVLIELLGRYSLILYFFHVALIKVLSSFPVLISTSFLSLAGFVVLITGICVVFAKFLDVLIRKDFVIQNIYRFLFR